MSWAEQRKGEMKEAAAKQDLPTVETSCLVSDTHIIEQILNDHHPKFVIYNVATQQIETKEDFLGDEGVLYRPFGLDHEEIKTQAVKLPVGVEEYGTLKDLINDIDVFIRDWLDVPTLDREFLIYHILMSWVYERFFNLSYPRALGDTGTGKSRYLDVIGGLMYKPMQLSGAATTAPIFRIISKWKGTLIIDEADPQKGSDETNYLIKIFNCGYEPGRPIARCDENDRNKIHFFDVYGPKVFATRRRFQDAALESRCMTTIMSQTNKKIPDTKTPEFERRVGSLRNKLLLFRLKNYWKVDPEAGIKVEMEGIEPRLRQISRGILALLAQDEEAKNRFLGHLRARQIEIVEERAASYDGQIFLALCELLKEGVPNITPTTIADRLANEMFSVRAIGKHVKALGLKFERRKVDGKTANVFVYDTLTFRILLDRYMIDEEDKNELVTMVTSVTSVTVNPPKQRQLLEEEGESIDLGGVTIKMDSSHN